MLKSILTAAFYLASQSSPPTLPDFYPTQNHFQVNYSWTTPKSIGPSIISQRGSSIDREVNLLFVAGRPDFSDEKQFLKMYRSILEAPENIQIEKLVNLGYQLINEKLLDDNTTYIIDFSIDILSGNVPLITACYNPNKDENCQALIVFIPTSYRLQLENDKTEDGGREYRSTAKVYPPYRIVEFRFNPNDNERFDDLFDRNLKFTPSKPDQQNLPET